GKRCAGAEWLRKIGRASVNTLRIPSSKVSATPLLVCGSNRVFRSRRGMPERCNAMRSRSKVLGGYDNTDPVSSMLWNVKIARMVKSMKALGSSDRGDVREITLNVALRCIQSQKTIPRAKGKVFAQSRLVDYPCQRSA